MKYTRYDTISDTSLRCLCLQSIRPDVGDSAFWGQSFVAELTRLSRLGKKRPSISGGDLDEGVDLKADEKESDVKIKVSSPEVDGAPTRGLDKAVTA